MAVRSGLCPIGMRTPQPVPNGPAKGGVLGEGLRGPSQPLDRLVEPWISHQVSLGIDTVPYVALRCYTLLSLRIL